MFRNFLRVFPRKFSSCKNSDNLTLILYGKRDLKLESRPIPKPKSNQVLLQMESNGICGSDNHFYAEGKIGHIGLDKPMVIGHEAAGTVLEIGKKVKNLKPGDRVAIEPGIGCRTCSFCKTGRYHLCPEMRFCSCPPTDGNMSRYYVHDSDFCFNMSFDEGALVEPLACGVHCCNRGNVRFGDVVLIMGAGPVGLVTMFAAKAKGASCVLVIDTVDYRLQKALELGADCVYKIEKNTCDEEIITDIKKILGEDSQVTIDCTGAEQCIRVASEVTKTGGVVALAGLVDVRGVFRYVNDYPAAIEMVRSGKANVLPLITHHFQLKDSVKAFETVRTKDGNPIKVMIHPNPDWQRTK